MNGDNYSRGMTPSKTKVKLEAGSTDNQARTDRHGSSRDYPVCLNLFPPVMTANSFSLPAMIEGVIGATENEAELTGDVHVLLGIEAHGALVAMAM
jgi:hypothetical protein